MYLSPDMHDIKKFMPVFIWWLSTATVVVLLKHHYSVATTEQLDWVLRPLAQLLEWLTGYAFKQDMNKEWLSEDANVRLVKSCAGINFMIMSLLAYAWVLQPELHRENRNAIEIKTACDYLLLFTAILIIAWATGLLANSLRIIIAMHFQGNALLHEFTNLPETDIHRIIGICVYAPLISIQMLAGDTRSRKKALMAPCLLYALTALFIPVITGNAFANLPLFTHHALQLCSTLFILFIITRTGIATKTKLEKIFNSDQPA